MNNLIRICMYRKRDNRASLVFKKKNVLYRITTIEHARQVSDQLNKYISDLDRGQADPRYILQVSGTRNRSNILELSLDRDVVTLCVYEDMKNGSMKLCFNWKGVRTSLIKS